MNVPKGKPSTSPPVQISQQPSRNIVPVPPRGQTPPIRTDFTVLDPQSYSYQAGFAVSAASHPHEMSKQTVTSGGLPQPGLTPQTSIYSANPRPFYPGQQQQMRQPRPQYMNNMPGQAPMYQQMVYVSPSNAYPNQAGQIMYQPQNVMYGQRMPQQYATIPNNVQQPFQQYPANQAYASGTQQSYPLYYQQQPQQQTQAMPVGPIAPTRPASVPNQTAPPKRERNPITIVDPTTKKDVTDEILHHKSTPPSSTGTPVSFPVSTSPPQQQNEICAQFASQVAATLRSQPSKHSSNSSDGMASPHVSDSTQGSSPPEPNQQQNSNEMQQNQQHSINMASSDVIKGETSVDPPSFIPDLSVKSNQHQKDPVVFEANEYNVNVSSMQKEATASKAAVVSANLDNLPEKELPPSKSESVSIPSQPLKNNIDVKSGSVSAQNVTESRPKSSNEVIESVPRSQKIPVTVSVKNSSPPPADTKDVQKPKSEGSVEKAEVAPSKSKTSVPSSRAQTVVDHKEEESVKSTPKEPKLQSPVPVEKEVEEIKQTPKEEVKESGPSTTEKDKESRDSTSPLDNKTVPEQTPPTKSEANESVIKEEPVAPPVSVSTDNKNETIPQVEIKIEDVDVSKENAKNNEMTSEALNNSQVPKKAEMQLQYKYKPEQWSPVNPEGKMSYDREFLLQLQFADNSVSKPQGLPNLPDIILDRPQVNPSKINDMGSTVRDFTPDFFQPIPGGRTGSSQLIRKKNSQSGPRNEPGKKIIKTISISSQDIKLHKAEKAWEPERKKDKNEMTEEEKEETKTKEIYKQVKSILNKLTPQKFQTLLRQVTELDINTESRLIGVTDLIFEKAVSEPAFSVAYANLCRYLSQLKVPSDTKPGEVNFRTILLTNCQKEFMKDSDVETDLEERKKKIEEATNEEIKKTLEDEFKVAASSARRRSTGNIRFIGELFKLKMLTVNIMHNCVFKLLKSRDEENLECLCRLLTTIGKELDEAKAKTRVDQYFQQMSKIVSEKKTSSRIRFLLQDVIDLRLRNWVPRREDYNPKTIDQIHKDAAKESAQKALLLSQPLPPSTPKHDSRRDSRDGRSTGRGGGPPHRGSQNARNDDGWTPVSSKSLRNIDLSKMKITKTPVDDNIQLGPGGGSSRFGVWGRGSSGGGLATKSSSQESESPANNAPANRFTALRPEDDGRPFGRGTSPARSDSRNRGMGGFGRGTLTPRSSQEMDRERAIANVRNIAGRGSNPASRENSRTRESRIDQKLDTHIKPLSEEEIEKKTKSIIDEYLHINDIKEACLCVSEINHPSNIHQFVEMSINSVLERSKIARQQTGNLHHELIKKNIIPVEAYLKGLKQTLEIAEDMEIDIPKIWQYLGELIGPMIQDGCVPLNFLKQACQPLRSSGKSGILVSEILHDASQRWGHKKIAQLWRNSELTWTDFVDEEDVKQFLIDKGLEFTVANDSAPSTPVDKVSFETIQEQLLVRLRDENCDNEHIFDWIEANIPDEMTKCPRFIRTLMTAVCKSAIEEGVNCKVSHDVIKKRQALLVKYIDNQQEFEIQALYALQALVNELQHPPGVLRSFFEYFYDEDVISETGFTQWSDSEDPAEQEGKGVAMKAVVQFFAWLKEGENEDS